MEMMATESRSGELMVFAREAAALVLRREMILPAVLLVLILTTSNILVLMSAPPPHGTAPLWQFIAAALFRLIGLLVLAVAILRIATGSERPRWRPDGGFWLYALMLVATLGLASAIRRILGVGEDLPGLLVGNVASTIVIAPLAAWAAATAVARPLAWDPRRWLRGFRSWLPHYLFWTLLLTTPIAVAHGLIDMRLVAGAGEWFWLLALIDGPLSTLLAFVGLGLGAAAYRRVA